MTRPVVYWRPGCPYCATLKLRLRLSRIGFDAVDIHQDPDAAALVRSVNGGDELVPTVRVGEVYLSNPGVREVKAALAAAR
jgi:mycoredoxin